MSEISDVDRRVPVGEWNGKPLVLTRPTFASECAMADLLEGKALEAVQRHRRRMRGDTYLVAVKAWTQDCAAGVYQWGGDAFRRAIEETDDGLKDWLTLLLQQAQPAFQRADLEPLFAARGQEFIDAYLRLVAPAPFPTSPTA